MKLVISLVTSLFLISISYAEIKKTVIPGKECGGMCFHWWPVLPVVEGWNQDVKASYNYSANAQAPNNYTFSNSETVIYSKALFKPRMPKIKSIEALIESDLKKFNEGQELIVSKIAPLATADGKKVITYSFYPKNKGNWEHVGYSEEGEFFLLFTISSRTKSGLVKNLPAYNKFVSEYRE